MPDVTSDINEEVLLAARVKFYEVVDTLKKEKIIKSTLELVIESDEQALEALSTQDREDWFVVSGIALSFEGESLGSFSHNDVTYTIKKATKAKCPRCWKYQSTTEDKACKRCEDVVA